MRPLWVEVRHPETRKLLFRVDVVNDVIECKPVKTKLPALTDLRLLKAQHTEQIESILTGKTGKNERLDRQE